MINNSNTKDDVYGAGIIAVSRDIARVHPVHMMNTGAEQSGRPPLDKVNRIEPQVSL